MAEKKRLNLSFSMASPQQREAWGILRAIPAGRRTDAVCRMVCQAYEQDRMVNAVRTVIREELKKINYVPTTEKTKQPQAGDVDENVLGFLFALQKEGCDTD